MIRLLCLITLWTGACCMAHGGGAERQPQTGLASWYDLRSGHSTASGERLDPNAMTAAHRTLPFGTKVRVTHLKTKSSTVVRINDRGPYTKGRIIDVSKAAGKELNMIGSGTARVSIAVVSE